MNESYTIIPNHDLSGQLNLISLANRQNFILKYVDSSNRERFETGLKLLSKLNIITSTKTLCGIKRINLEFSIF